MTHVELLVCMLKLKDTVYPWLVIDCNVAKTIIVMAVCVDNWSNTIALSQPQLNL